jgi:hypothetical protein
MKKSNLIIFGCFLSFSVSFSQVKILIDGSLQGNQSGALRINTGQGYVDIGPKTSGSCHFYTDQSNFYFDKPLQINSGLFTVTNSSDYSFKKASSSFPLLLIRNSNGYVGINNGPNYPQYQLDVNGIIRGANLSPTHSTVKAGNEQLETEMVINIFKLKGISYIYEPAEIPEFGGGEKTNQTEDEYYKREHFSFDIFDLEKYFPSVVYRDSLGVPGIMTDELLPLVIEALKMQNKLIKALEKDLNILKSSGKNAPEMINSDVEDAWLGQNVPNPFNENTSIEFYLPSSVENAIIFIYDLQGKQIKNIAVEARESGQVVINGAELQPGMYYYTLIADGKEIGMEKMVLTD